MRKFLALLFLLAAVVRSFFDWTATVSNGEAWRFAGAGELLEAHFPGAFLNLQTLMSSFLSHKALAFYAHNIHGIPLVAILLFIAGFFWMISGPARRTQQRMVFSRS